METVKPRPGNRNLSRRPATLRLLGAANWVLLGVSWGMSLYTYARLPGEMASWLSAWRSDQAMVGKSIAFFLNPVLQVSFFFAFLILTRKFFINAPHPTQGSRFQDDSKTGQLRGLREEVVYLVLIFCSLIFIHLQTSRILVSHRLAAGINKFYFMMLVLVLIILVPYYQIRRQILFREHE